LRGIRGDVVWEIVEAVADKLSPIAVEVTGPEFFIGFVDGFEEGVGDTREGRCVFGIDAALGESVEETCEALCERGCGNEVTGNRFDNFGGGVVGLAEVAELALVVEAEFGPARRAKHAALTAIGIGKSTQRRAVFGVVGRHKRLQKLK
jgi:hypothetical protein